MKRFKISLAVLAIIFATASAFTTRGVVTQDWYFDASGVGTTQLSGASLCDAAEGPICSATVTFDNGNGSVKPDLNSNVTSQSNEITGEIQQ